MDRCKNFFALGMCYWLFKPADGRHHHAGSSEKFAKKPLLAEANIKVLKAG